MLELQEVDVTFTTRRGQVEVLSRFDLSVSEGEFVVLVGPSGCGKSTALRVAAGLQPMTRGHAFVNGQEITGPGRERGMAFQHHTLFPWRTALENVRYGLDLQGMRRADANDRAASYLRLVGLEDFGSAFPSQLSGGMQQRVAIARLFANDPEILLMDEPFGALDAFTRRDMQSFLLEIWQESGKGVLFVTHDIEEAVLLGDRVVVMQARPSSVVKEVRIDLARPRGAKTLFDDRLRDYRASLESALRNEPETR